MAITSILRNFTGDPNIVTMVTDESFATITAAGYLSLLTTLAAIDIVNKGDFQWQDRDLIIIKYGTNGLGQFTRDAATNSLIPYLVNSGTQSFTPSFTFSTPGNLSVAYVFRTGTWIRNGNVNFVSIDMSFTPTYTTASGNGLFSLPNTVITAMGGTVESTGANITYPAGRTFLSALPVAGVAFGLINAIGSAVSTVTIGAAHMPTATLQTFLLDFIYVS